MSTKFKLANILTDALSKSAGVYAIRTRRDERVYVGASQQLGKACTAASRTLQLGCHENRALQAYATAHGLAALTFDVLTVCPVTELATTKQRYLDQLRACDPAHGFNSLNLPAPAGQKMGAEARTRMRHRRPARRTQPPT